MPTSGTAAKLQLSTDNSVITDDGRTDCQLIVQVQDASGKWISNAPAITLTDKSGLGLFPGGSTITFIGGAVDKGVLNGQSAIEYRSYTAGTAAIEATSSGLAASSVTITVNHVSDTVTTAIGPKAVVQNPAIPEMPFIKTAQNRILLPQAMRGKKVMATVYDPRGRLLFSKTMINRNVINLTGKDFAGTVFLVKVRTLE